ncbi:hypothetical protein D3C86_1981910 [compost metagenome]
MLARWLSAVIGSPRRSRALPPRATTIRMVSVLLSKEVASNAVFLWNPDQCGSGLAREDGASVNIDVD